MKKKTLNRSSSDDVETALPDICENEVVFEVKNKKHKSLKRKYNENALETEAELEQHVSVSPVKKKRKTETEIGHRSKPSDQSSVGHEKKHKVKQSHVCNEDVENDTETVDTECHKNSQYLRSADAKDARHLLDRMSEVLKNTATDHNEDFKKTLANFDWNQVAFDSYTADDCKQFWTSVSRRIRKFRTLAELVNDVKDARRIFIHKDAQEISQKPKRPLSPLFLFYQKKMKPFIRKHPGMPNSKAAQILAVKFANLPSSKKQKYVDQYSEAKKLYDQEMAKYRADHPSQRHSSQTSSASPKHMTAARFYVEQKCQEKMSQVDGKGNKPKLMKRYRKRWESLSDEQKLEFINTAIQDNADGDSAAKPHIVLSKSEQQLKDKAEGKLPRPPRSGYVIFLKKFCSSTDADGKRGKHIDAHEAWVKLSDKKKEHYNKKARKAKEEYMKQNPQEQVSQGRSKKKRRQLFGGGPMKPLSDYELFVEGEMPGITASDHTLTIRKKLQICKQRWLALSQSERNKWESKAAAALQNYRQQLEQFKSSLSPDGLLRYESQLRDEDRTSGKKRGRKQSKKKVLFDGEPKKPLNAYSMYTQSKMNELDKTMSQRERLIEAGRTWSQELSAEEKQYWQNKALKAQRKYEKALERFKQGLSEEELLRYESLKHHAGDKTPKKSKKGVRFEGEPKKPLSAYALFTQVKMSEMDKSLSQRERMMEAGRLWSSADKQYWQDKALEARQVFQRDLELFKQTLAPEQLNEYERSQKKQTSSKH